MISQSKGKIFLSYERGVNKTDWFSSYNTFNFGNYFSEHKKPVGDIYVFNDDSLDAGHSLRMIVEETSYILLLPVMGAIDFKAGSGNDGTIAAGQIQILTLKKGEIIEIKNPFSEGLVNFLQVWIKSNNEIDQSYLSTFDVNNNLNSLLEISSQLSDTPRLPFTIYIGKFSGRGETVYKMKNNHSILFAFVIEGVFELEGRLLQARDALALWDIEQVEIEALSNDVIMFIVENFVA